MFFPVRVDSPPVSPYDRQLHSHQLDRSLACRVGALEGWKNSYQKGTRSVVASSEPLVATYLDSLTGKADSTVDAYARVLRNFLAWLRERPGSTDTFQPATFTRTAVETYLASLEQHLSISSRARTKSVLGSFARWLIEEQGLLRRNPTRGVTIPAQALLAPRELSADQRYVLRSLVEREDTPRGTALFALGYWAGCRVSDVS